MTLSVIQIESAGRRYAIHDNTESRTYSPASLHDAMVTAAVLMRAGHRLDLGLMQINYEVWLRNTQVRLDQAFDPCINIGFGTTILSAAYARALTRARSPADALIRALSTYNSGDERHAVSYAKKVLTSGNVLQQHRVPTGARPVPSP